MTTLSELKAIGARATTGESTRRRPWGAMMMMICSQGDLGDLGGSVHREVWEISEGF